MAAPGSDSESRVTETAAFPLQMAIFVIRDAQAVPQDNRIILKGQEVLSELPSVANAVAILLGLLYALNLEYPKTLKVTFEYIQKVLMELDLKGMTPKVKRLYDQIYTKSKSLIQIVLQL